MSFFLRGSHRFYKYLGQLNNSNESRYFYVIMFRITTYVPGKALHSKPNIDLPFASNHPTDGLGFVDGYLGEKAALQDKAQ